MADITYIRLRREFVYLAVVLDAYSRRCIGWALSRHIDTELALKALRMALETRTVRIESQGPAPTPIQTMSQNYCEIRRPNE